MASTIIITCIHFALEAVDLLLKVPASYFHHEKRFKMLRFKLKNLKTFVVSARKLSNDGRLGSFLVRLEDTIRRNAERIHPRRLDLNSPATSSHLSMGPGFRKDIQSLEEEIEKWYVKILDYCYMRQSSSLTTDEVSEIIGSVLESLMEFHSLRSMILHAEILGEALEALGEQMTFLKSLLRFATERSVEPRQDLLAHTEAVAINAAFLLFTCGVDEFDEESRQGMLFKISTLLRKIKPIDPQVCLTYTQALSNSKFAPTQDMNGDAFIATKNFLDSLISNLWEMLSLNTCRVISMKDQLQQLYEGLRSLRTMLKQQPYNFDLKIKEDIGAVLCDAGVLICSFNQTNIEVDLGLQHLLGTIKIILAEVGEKDLQVSTFNFPRTNELGFVDVLLEKLTELTSCQVEASRVRTVQEELVFLRSFLGEIVDLRNEQEELQTLWDRVLEVAYKVEYLIDHLVVGDLLDSFSTSFDSITKDIRNIKADVLKIFRGQEIEIKKIAKSCGHVPAQRTPSVTNEVVGFDNEARSIMERLLRGSKRLRIVAIVGMSGQGKTTLAAKVYNDPSVLRYFCVRAWCLISQIMDKKKVLLDLVKQIDPRRSSPEMTEQDLVEKLRRSLKGRRYLIFLDDIWDIEAWNSLEVSFPDDTAGSRIILTSRLRNIAPRDMLDQEPHFLRQLNEKESSELLQKKLFPENGWPPALRDIGMQIAENCKGLPLAITIVAGILATTEPEDWKKILNGLNSGVVSSTENCRNTLELSYKHLPDYLRSCLLYFGAFPRNQEVTVRKLFGLWIAEGFVRKVKTKSLEDIAEDYLKDLIGRSLILVAKQKFNGGVKTCRIHDLLYDFCLQKANDEHFFHFLKGYDELLPFNEHRNLRRLCIQSDPKHFKQSKLFCPHARSILFNSSQETQVLLDISFVIHIFKLLRVLDLEQICLGSVFPSEIELLVLLAFLAVRGKMKHIPSSIANLSNLETFIVDSQPYMLSLPDSLWNLQKLKYLYIRSSRTIGGGSLPIQNLDCSYVLHELHWLSGVIIPSSGSMEKLMRKFPKVRKLKCQLFKDWNDVENLGKIVVPDFLCQLESLDISLCLAVPSSFPFEFSLPTNLKKLTLSGFYLSWRNISTIGKLQNLEALKLVDISFEERILEMKEGEFSKLRILKLASWSLVRWRACDDQFVYFQKLVLSFCQHLEEMPSCLESAPTLEMIELSDCPETVVNLVRQIEEEQVRLGNSDLKIITGRIW